MCPAEVASRDSPLQMERIMDPSLTHKQLHPLDPSSHYIFKVIAFTAAGDGPPITRRGATLLEGGETWPQPLKERFLPRRLFTRLHFPCHLSLPAPPSNISIVAGNTSFNLSWVPGERDRNHGFHFEYLRKSREFGLVPSACGPRLREKDPDPEVCVCVCMWVCCSRFS